MHTTFFRAFAPCLTRIRMPLTGVGLLTLSVLAVPRWGWVSVGAEGRFTSAAGAVPSFTERASTAALQPAGERVRARYGNLPLAFEANRGQTDGRVKFLSRGSGYTLFLTADEAVLSLISPRRAPGEPFISISALSATSAVGSSHAVVRMKLVGADPRPRVVGLEELPGKVNYFLGSDPKQWRTNVPLYGKVRYEAVYPGVDLVYHGNQRQLEYDFVVAPGANADRIRLQFAGAEKIEVDVRGDLLLHAGGGVVRQPRPFVYQEVAGERRVVAGSYVLLPASDEPPTTKNQGPRTRDQGRGTTLVAFRIGAHDRSRPLVIDPVLVYSTYLGGSGTEVGRSLAVDASGNAYVTGRTMSANFPTTPGAAVDTSYNGSGELGLGDAFVTKLNSAGSALVYSTYLGGSGDEEGYGIALDASNNAYVTGTTTSANFPMANAFQAAKKNFSDAFVARLNAAGSALVYSTYFGGSDVTFDFFLRHEAGFAVAVDASDNAYVTGLASSADFPVTPGAYDTTFNGVRDGFLAKFNTAAAGAASRVYCTYLGSGGDDFGGAVTVDASGNAYATGGASDGFPVTAGAFDTSFNGVRDAYVAKLNAAGSALVYSTYLGGSAYDDTTLGGPGTITVDAGGNVFVAGRTLSANFPTTPGAFDTTYNGGWEAFVTKLNATGSGLIYSTYLGGSGDDLGRTVADAAGNAYVVGITSSLNFPMANALQAGYGGGPFDAFVTKLNALGSALLFSTYLGGSGDDEGLGIALGPADDCYVAGLTASINFPITVGAFQVANGGGFDAFVAKIAENQSPTANAGGPYTVSEGGSVMLTGAGHDPNADPLIYAWDLDNNGTFETPGQNPTFSAAGRDGPGSQMVVLQVCDNKGACATSSATVNLTNVPPAITPPADQSADEGTSKLFSLGSFADPGPDNPWNVDVDWGDGSAHTLFTMTAAGAMGARAHPYADNGTYTVMVQVTDNDGASDTRSFKATVLNVPPTVNAGPDAMLFSGQSHTVNASFTDPALPDTHTATIDWGDGSPIQNVTVAQSPGSGSLTAAHRYLLPQIHTITVRVTDDDGGTGSDTLLLEVKRLPVAIDVKPGSYPNSINLGSGGTVPVAILSGTYAGVSLDATTVDPLTVTLASAPVALKGKGTPQASIQDVNGDGLADLVVHVSTQALQLSETDTEAVLEGQTYSGIRITGKDTIRVVP